MYKGRHMLIRKKINDTSLPGFEARKPENLLHEVIVYTLYIQVPFSPKLQNQILLIYHPLNYNACKCAFSSITSIQTKHHKIQPQFSELNISFLFWESPNWIFSSSNRENINVLGYLDYTIDLSTHNTVHKKKVSDWF